MYRYIEIMISSKLMKTFGFLKDSPTLSMKSGSFFLLIYYEPPTVALQSVQRKGLSYTVHNDNRTEILKIRGWEVVRNYKIATCPDELLDILRDLEFEELLKYRQGSPVVLNGWFDGIFQSGLYTLRDVYTFVYQLFERGYDIESMSNYFALLTRRKELTSYFYELVTYLFRKGDAWTKRSVNV